MYLLIIENTVSRNVAFANTVQSKEYPSKEFALLDGSYCLEARIYELSDIVTDYPHLVKLMTGKDWIHVHLSEIRDLAKERLKLVQTYVK